MAPSLALAYRIRPLQLGDILDEAFRIYRARFGLLAGAALIASVPGLLFGLGGGATTLVTAYMQSTVGASSAVDAAGLSQGLLVFLAASLVLGAIFYPVTAAIPYFAASAAVLGLRETPGSILLYSLKNYFKLWVPALANLLMGIFSVFILPIYFIVRWSFVYPAYYLERVGVNGSFARSSRLCTNSWWRIFGIRALGRLVVTAIAFGLGVLAAVPALLMPLGVVRQGTTGFLSALVAAVLLPYPALVLVLLYMDQRVRLESLDLQLMAGAAGSHPAAPTGDPYVAN